MILSRMILKYIILIELKGFYYLYYQGNRPPFLAARFCFGGYALCYAVLKRSPAYAKWEGFPAFSVV